jgi:hypothetical protein
VITLTLLSFFGVTSAPAKCSYLAPQTTAVNGDIDQFMTEYRVTAIVYEVVTERQNWWRRGESNYSMC